MKLTFGPAAKSVRFGINIPKHYTGIYGFGVYHPVRVIDIASSKPQHAQLNNRQAQSENISQFSEEPSSADSPEERALRQARQVFGERSSIFTTEYQTLLKILRQARHDTGLTQVQVGERLGQPQAIISKCERGERRLDVVELRAYCTALGISYLHLLERLESELTDITDIK